MSNLFKPVSVGPVKLDHRLVMAPLTRFRADDHWVPTSMAREYYEQRACVPGTLIISEATLMSSRAISAPNVPGIWSDEQVAGWKPITDAVHAKGCRMVCQLWHMGRAGNADVLASQGCRFLSSTATPIDPSGPTPEAMTEEDIQQTIADYAAAAKNAIKAGFDLVEIHGANGYLLDQFLQDTCNQRTDSWGGSIENRARLLVEVTKAVSEAIGSNRTAVRLSPYSDYLGMLMEDPDPTFAYAVKQLKTLSLAYLHLVEARIRGNEEADCGGDRTVKWLVELWDNASPVLVAGGFNDETAKTAIDEVYKGYEVLIVFGRYFVSNPDLVFRIRAGIPLTAYSRASFYTPKNPAGYIDYPYSSDYLAKAAA